MDVKIANHEPAEHILLAYIRGKSSEEENRQVEKWLKLDEENEKILLQIATIDFAQNRQQQIKKRAPLQAWERGKRRIRNRRRIPKINRLTLVTTCVLTAVLVGVIGYQPQEALMQQQMVTVQANPGMRSIVDLPDGTVVYLNAGSKLSYPIPYDATQRNVTLTGEAYFKVSHHADWPFVASVADDRFQVKVLGTEFNLQAFEHDTTITATLISGRIDVLTKEMDDIRRVQSVLPSEKTSYNRLTGKINIEKVNTQYETAWIDGKIMFKNCRLPEVLKKLTYAYNVKFEVNNPVINDYHFTGVFDNKQLSQILDYLQISSNIKYQIRQVTEDDSHGVNHTVVILR